MAKFLTDQDFADIRSAINDTIETFAQLQVTYKKNQKRTRSRFNRELTDNQVFDDFTLNVLQVWEKNEKGMSQVDKKGKWDFSEGYLLTGFDSIETLNLVDGNGNLTMDQNVDKLLIRGIEYEVMGIITLGQLKDKDCLVKIQFKKLLKNE